MHTLADLAKDLLDWLLITRSAVRARPGEPIIRNAQMTPLSLFLCLERNYIFRE